MGQQVIELMAHLMLRTGFGATRDELDAYAAKGYEATVDRLLNPGEFDHNPRIRRPLACIAPRGQVLTAASV